MACASGIAALPRKPHPAALIEGERIHLSILNNL
jgi:hypothetical protein